MDPAVLSVYWGDEPATAAIDNMYRIMRAKDGKENSGKARRIRWEELVCVLERLELHLGWEVVEGTDAYTKDEDSHKSRVLGESKQRIRHADSVHR